MVLNPDVVVRQRGVMEKCSFCVQRIQLSRIEARNRGETNFEVKTACQQSCPANAITFGDGTDPKSAVSKTQEDPRKFQVLADIGVKPSITYLARVRTRES
jgi:molybdopterin-containing oxidoreductase family iron-sulfur binding subunit